MGEKVVVVYPHNCIDQIIFGLKMPQKERNTIRYILKNKGVKFFEAVKSKQHFSIEIRPMNILAVNYDEVPA